MATIVYEQEDGQLGLEVQVTALEEEEEEVRAQLPSHPSSCWLDYSYPPAGVLEMGYSCCRRKSSAAVDVRGSWLRYS